MLPGNIAANKTIIGTQSRPKAIVIGWPTPTAESKPMYIFPLPAKCLSMKAPAASEIGIKPSINNAAILGINTIVAAIVTAQLNALEILYPPSIAITKPKTKPTMIGSPKIPIFSCKPSKVKSTLFNPGIFSIIQFKIKANGTNAAVNPCGIETQLHLSHLL